MNYGVDSTWWTFWAVNESNPAAYGWTQCSGVDSSLSTDPALTDATVINRLFGYNDTKANLGTISVACSGGPGGIIRSTGLTAFGVWPLSTNYERNATQWSQSYGEPGSASNITGLDCRKADDITFPFSVALFPDGRYDIRIAQFQLYHDPWASPFQVYPGS